MSRTSTPSTATTTSSSSSTSIHNSEDPHTSEQVLNPTFDDDSDLGEWSWVTPANPNVPDIDLNNWENFDWYEGLSISDFESNYDHNYSNRCDWLEDLYLEETFPDLSLDFHDPRIFARRNQRWRKHLDKYGRKKNLAAPRPIPYSIALQTPNSLLVPEIEAWAYTASKDKFNHLLHPKNQPKNPTIQSEKRRVYALGKVAACMSMMIFSDKCTCSECKYWRSEQQKTKVKYFKGELEEETREAKCREWEEWERQRGGTAWWEEPHEGEEENDVTRPELVNFVWSGGNNAQRPSEWAKLVDDAVNVWGCKRKTAVEQMGWEVCNHGGDGGDGDDDCNYDSDDCILKLRPRDQSSPTPLEGKD